MDLEKPPLRPDEKAEAETGEGWSQRGCEHVHPSPDSGPLRREISPLSHFGCGETDVSACPLPVAPEPGQVDEAPGGWGDGRCQAQPEGSGSGGLKWTQPLPSERVFLRLQ